MEEKDEPPDPGWRPALKYLIFLFFLPLILWGVRRWGDSRLIVLRGAHLVFCVAMINLVPSIIFVDQSPNRIRTSPTSIGLFTLVAILPFLALWRARRASSLSCDDGPSLVASFTSRWFLQIAFAVSPALYGFIATFHFQDLWPFFVGLGITAVGLVLCAPTRRAIDRVQARLDAEGCELSLRRALAEFSPPLNRHG